MTRSNLALTAAGLIAVGAMIVAGAIMWLLIMTPAMVASAVNAQDMMPLLQAVIGVIYQALVEFVRYL